MATHTNFKECTFRSDRRKRIVAAWSFGLAITVGLSTSAVAQNAPRTPPEITPPSGNVAFLTAHAAGTQNFICQPAADSSGTTWRFLGPQATLSVNFSRFTQQVMTHFLSAVPSGSPNAQPGCTVSADGTQLYCPTWQSSYDSSAVWGSVTGRIDAGSDPSCPNAGAAACLLLKAAANRPGSFGNGLLARTTYVQRLNTVGGSAPTGSCQVGDLALVPYTADYTYFK